MQGKKPAQGLRIEETKYQIVRTFDDEASGCYTVIGKRVKLFNYIFIFLQSINVITQTMGGCCAVLTKKVIILAVFDEKQGHVGSSCNETVAALAKHLMQSGS